MSRVLLAIAILVIGFFGWQGVKELHAINDTIATKAQISIPPPQVKIINQKPASRSLFCTSRKKPS